MQTHPYSPDSISFSALNSPQPPLLHPTDPQPRPLVDEIRSPAGLEPLYRPNPDLPPPSPRPTPQQQQQISHKGSDGREIIYHTALPLYSLQRDPAPVDCPRCRVRSMSKISHSASTATQYVAFPPLSSHLLLCFSFEAYGQRWADVGCSKCVGSDRRRDNRDWRRGAVFHQGHEERHARLLELQCEAGDV